MLYTASGYTDRTPVIAQDNNYCRHLCFQACGFESRESERLLSLNVKQAALQFFFMNFQN